MKYIITGRNIEVTEGLKSAIYEKIGKLERYFTPDATVYVTLSVQKDRQKIEVTIPVKGSLVRAEQESSDMYVSIDLVEEIIEREALALNQSPNAWLLYNAMNEVIYSNERNKKNDGKRRDLDRLVFQRIENEFCFN